MIDEYAFRRREGETGILALSLSRLALRPAPWAGMRRWPMLSDRRLPCQAPRVDQANKVPGAFSSASRAAAPGRAGDVDLMELEQGHALGARLDDEVGVPARRLGRVGAAEQQHAGQRLAEARRPRRGRRRARRAVRTLGRRLDVDRDHRALAHVGHDADRQVVDQRPVDEQLASAHLRRGDHGQADAEAHRLVERAPPRDAQAPAAQLGRAAHEAAGQLLDGQGPEGAVEHRACALAADQGVPRKRVVVERPALHPFLEAAGVDLVRVEPHGEQRADERPHAHARDAIDRHAGRGELLEDADVREGARAAAGQHDADGPSGHAPGEARQIRVELVGAQHMGLDRIERGGHPGEGAGAGGHVVGDEVAPAQLVPARDRGRERAAGREHQDPVGLLEAEAGPAVVVRCGAGVEHHEVVLALRPVEQRAVEAGGSLPLADEGASREPSSAVSRWRARAAARPEAIASDGSPRSAARTATVVGRGRVDRAGTHLAQLLGQGAGQSEGEGRSRAEQLLEVVAVDGEEVGGARRPDRRRARLAREQGQLADGVAAADLADHRSRRVLEDVHAPGADDVERVAGLAFPEQPLACGHPHRPRALRDRVPERRVQAGEHRDAREEVRRGLGTRLRRLRGVDADRPARGRTLAGRRVGERLLQHGPRRGAERRRLGPRRPADEQAAESGDDEAGRPERPRPVERRRGLGGRGRPEDRDDEGDAQRGTDLARDRVQPRRRGVLRPGRRRHGCGGQVGQQRSGADPEEQDRRQPLAEEVGRHPHARHEPHDGRGPHRPPATSTGRGPKRVTRWLVGTATAAATNGPGVIARPASSTEYCQTAVRNSTLTSV